jgi:hypothetical protein
MLGPRTPIESVLAKEKLARKALAKLDDARGVERCVVNERVQLHIDAQHAPGREDRFNFFVHGKKLMFAPMSLNYFSERSPCRQAAVWLATHRYFENTILGLIMLNSVILALTDFRHVDLDTGALLTGPSWRNALVEGVDPVFTALFTAESALKIFAMGFLLAPGCYLTDPWNWLDLLVVVAGLLGLMPGVPKFSALRTFRVLRPLKSLNAVPGMKKLVTSLLSSIPELLHVVLFLGFLFFVFGIFGVALWNGGLHGRCRTTPFPLALPAAEAAAYPPSAAFVAAVAARQANGTLAAMYCGAGETWGGAGGGPTPLRDKSWSKLSSPWHEPRRCVWLLDEAVGERLCALPDRGGSFLCPAGSTCGANWDELGNARFVDVGGTLMHAPTFVEGLGFGFLNFDHMGHAFLTIFQSITMEGWVDIMYQVMDSCGAVAGALYWVVLILFGAFFLMNLMLAVIWDNFAAAKEAEARKLAAEKAALAEEAKRKEKEAAVQRGDEDEGDEGEMLESEAERAAEKAARTLHGDAGGLDDGAATAAAEKARAHAKELASVARRQTEMLRTPVLPPGALSGRGSPTDGGGGAAVAARGRRGSRGSSGGRLLWGAKPGAGGQVAAAVGAVNVLKASLKRKKAAKAKAAAAFEEEEQAASDDTDDDEEEEEEPPARWGWAWWRAGARRLVETKAFEGAILGAILLNTAVLAADHHRMNCQLAHALEGVSLVLTLVFVLEMALKLLALGPRGYVADPFNRFDAVIVLFSVVEVVTVPPALLTGAGASCTADGEVVPEAGGGLGALRMFRLFRVFKMARSWVALQQLLVTIVQTLHDISYFSVLLLLFMYIYALVGMQFFSYRFRFDADTGLAIPRAEEAAWAAAASSAPRAHFDDLLWAFVTIFQVLTGENWNTVMYDGWRATGWASVIYFLSLVVFGAFIVLNLFLAILLGNFEGSADPGPPPGAEGAEKAEVEEVEDEEAARERRREKRRALREAERRAAERAAAPWQPVAGQRGTLAFVAAQRGSAGTLAQLCVAARLCFAKALRRRKVKPLPPAVAIQGFLSEEDIADAAAEAEAGRATRAAAKAAERSAAGKCWVPPGRALWLLRPTNPLRSRAAAVVQHAAFDNTILAAIVVSSMALALDNPLFDENSALVRALWYGDVFFAGLFGVEFVLKVTTLGFALHEGAYLRSGWNVLDFVIVIVSALTLAGSDSLKSLRSLRTLRALRPLRVISRNPGMKLVVNALISSVPQILNVAMVCFFFFLIFAIVGVSYFKGLFSGCQGDAMGGWGDAEIALLEAPAGWGALSAAQRGWFGAGAAAAYAALPAGRSPNAVGAPDVPTSKQICEWRGGEWGATVPQAFDNVAVGMVALFEMSTTEQWVDVMYAGVDATAVDMQPVRNNSVGWVAFFIAFQVIGGFFMMQLFVGVVIDNFNVMKEKSGGRLFMTASQREWVRLQKALLKVAPERRALPPPLPPRSWAHRAKERYETGGAVARLCVSAKWQCWRLRRWCFGVVTTASFEPGIMTCILLNTLLMAATHFKQSDDVTAFIALGNYFFAAVFTLEALAKVTALGPWRYWDDSWNRFDAVIVVGTLAGIILEEAAGIEIGPLASVVRSFRVGRVVRLVKGAKSLRNLFNTLVATLPSLGNIGSLLFLLFFIFAIMGVQLFAKVKFQDDGSLGPNAHFRDFGTALLLLIRASTGENWNGVMYDCLNMVDCVVDPPFNASVCGFSDHPGCEPLQGCGSGMSYAYFVLFTLLITVRASAAAAAAAADADDVVVM